MHSDTNVLRKVSRTGKHYQANRKKLAHCELWPTAVGATAHENRHAHVCDSREWPSHSTLALQPTGRNSHFNGLPALGCQISGATHGAYLAGLLPRP